MAWWYYRAGGVYLNQIELLREKLYKVLEAGDNKRILRISQKLDKLIVNYMEENTQMNRKTA